MRSIAIATVHGYRATLPASEFPAGCHLTGWNDRRVKGFLFGPACLDAVADDLTHPAASPPLMEREIVAAQGMAVSEAMSSLLRDMPSLSDHVSLVGFVVTDPEMRWIDAGGRIAVVARVHSLGDRAHGELVHEPMDHLPHTSKCRLAVSKSVLAALPYPAATLVGGRASLDALYPFGIRHWGPSHDLSSDRTGNALDEVVDISALSTSTSPPNPTCSNPSITSLFIRCRLY